MVEIEVAKLFLNEYVSFDKFDPKENRTFFRTGKIILVTETSIVLQHTLQKNNQKKETIELEFINNLKTIDKRVNYEY